MYPKILLIGAGASVSTKDVEQGFYSALVRANVDPRLFLLDARIEMAQTWVTTYWKKTKKSLPEPTWADVIYQASIGALERALTFDVDAVVIISAMYFHPDLLILFKRAKIPVFLLLTESPYEDETHARFLPFVTGAWTNERTSVDYLRQFNPNVFYMKHAYRPELHFKTPPKEHERIRAHDVLIIGTGFPERVKLLEAINWEGINLGLYGVWGYILNIPDHPLTKYTKQKFIPNDKTVRYYSRAKIVLNLYRDSTGDDDTTEEGMRRIDLAESLNPRAYELAATETFQISSYRQEVVETFGHSVPVFSSPEELEHQIRSYLSNDSCREDYIAIAKEQVKDDTFDNRAKQMVEQITGVLNGN